ncbi:spore protease YyaC [Aneurinibacillus sp. Ricciae_BoGa-3]|uniref:spore protease YyaC n=1 Tax=Aneurinibacillus sp. Ricciae_BoGa-3 TaxID=3022697 RepID=UPI00233F8CD9|nr:spore protease YyaC [Aneurinibacillus sp. Ricciae_BoGa-3]WCK54514.1 spore protease YyaC [Aneurinibacillus sp. Ricciae_BoGa-3]
MNNDGMVQLFPPGPFRIDHSEDGAIDSLSKNIQQRLKFYRGYSDIVVFCIGTDRSTGDSLGPLIGTKLESLYPRHFTVFGTLDDPVHAVNLSETIDRVHSMFDKPLVIAIDACLGQLSSVGKITVSHGPIKPGAGVKKNLPEVGIFHITGIVNIGGFMEYFVLQNTRLSVVMKMADTIAQSLNKAIKLTGSLRENSYRYVTPSMTLNPVFGTIPE